MNSEVKKPHDSGQAHAIARPPEKLKMRFCPACGRNDLMRDFHDKHFAGGKLCPGKPIAVTYKRESI